MNDSFIQDSFEHDSYKEIQFSSKAFNFGAKGRPNAEKDLVVDQLDDLEEADLSKDDYIQMALHYKTLCKVRAILNLTMNPNNYNNFLN